MNKIIISVVAAVVIIGSVFFWATKSAPEQKNTTTDTTTSSSDVKKSGGKLLSFGAQTVGENTDCSLYSRAEVSKIWGVPIVDEDINTVTSLSDGGKLYTCDYNETDSGLGLSFIIEFREFTSVDAAKQDIANVRNGAKFGDEVYFVHDEVSNIGDEAFFSVPAKKVNDPKNPNQQLYARKGNVVFLISAVNLDGVKSDYRDKILESFKLHLQ